MNTQTHLEGIAPAATSEHSWNPQRVPDEKRMSVLPKLFGTRLMILGEGSVYEQMGAMCLEYTGGFWDYYKLPGGIFYMVPTSAEAYDMRWAPNGFDGQVSADAAGVIVTLMALSYMSCRDHLGLCSKNFHDLRLAIAKHPEAALIYQAID